MDLSKDHATCVISDVSFGSEEIADRIRYVRIAEPIGWPYDNQLGGQRYGEKGPHLINWTPIRILGDVPVERDGSAHFEVPADTAVYFQLLDENRMELRRMRSFISFQPGETARLRRLPRDARRRRRARARRRWPPRSRRARSFRRPGATGRSASCATFSRSSTGTASSATAA